MDQLAVHFALDGNMIHRDSDEARRQMAKLGLPEGVLTNCNLLEFNIDQFECTLHT